MNVQFFGNNSENKRAKGPEPCCYFISVNCRFAFVPQKSKIASDIFPDLSEVTWKSQQQKIKILHYEWKWCIGMLTICVTDAQGT